MVQIRIATQLVFVVGFLAPSTKLLAGPFTITKIADVTTPYPGGAGNFSLISVPSFENGSLAFAAQSNQGLAGVFSWINGEFRLVADTTIPIPFGNGNFTGFDSRVSLSNKTIAFFGRGFNQQRGIYVADGGLQVIADRSTPVPGEPAGTTFTDFNSPVIDDSGVVFSGGIQAGNWGVYRHNQNGLSVVADRHTTLSNGEPILVAAHPVIDSAKVAFFALTENRTGLFLSSSTGISTIVDTTMTVPNGVNTFESFGQFNMKGDTVAFVAGTGTVPHSLYVKRNMTFETIADFSVPIPEGVGGFTNYLDHGIGLSGDMVAFSAFGDSDQHGIYLKSGTGLHKVIDRGDLLDGNEVLYFLMGRESFDGNQLAFSAVFHDLTSAIYIAQVPEPSTLSTLLLGALFTIRPTRNKRD